MKLRYPALLLLAIASLPAFAQSFNIDIGPPGSGPSAGYRAAGVSGVWNSFEGFATGVYPLVDVDGVATGAYVTQYGGTEIVQDMSVDPGDPSGNDFSLLGDALVTHTAIENCVFFHDIEDGTYEVLTYAWMPTAPGTTNRVSIDSNPNSTMVGGGWTGEHVEGTTFARHTVQVPYNGSWDLGQHSGVPDGGDLGVGAALNGVQIRKMTIVPPVFSSRTRLYWLTALDAPRYDVVRGDLGVLRASGGDFSQAIDTCAANDLIGLELPYAGLEPTPGNGYFYLVRGVGSHGGHTYDSPGGNQVGERDDEIDASPLACS